MSIAGLNKAFKAFKVPSAERKVASTFWSTNDKHALPSQKLTGSSRQLGMRLNV